MISDVWHPVGDSRKLWKANVMRITHNYKCIIGINVNCYMFRDMTNWEIQSFTVFEFLRRVKFPGSRIVHSLFACANLLALIGTHGGRSV